jgi:hypothetical protein
MITYCVLCRSQIPEARQRRAARTCSPGCQREYRRQYMQERNARFCKACGRGLRKASSETKQAKGTVFLAPHNGIVETVGSPFEQTREEQ